MSPFWENLSFYFKWPKSWICQNWKIAQVARLNPYMKLKEYFGQKTSFETFVSGSINLGYYEYLASPFFIFIIVKAIVWSGSATPSVRPSGVCKKVYQLNLRRRRENTRKYANPRLANATLPPDGGKKCSLFCVFPSGAKHCLTLMLLISN